LVAIANHLKNIFNSWELEEKVVYSKMEYTTKHWAIEWKTQKINSDFEKIILNQ